MCLPSGVQAGWNSETFGDGRTVPCDALILAVPWRRVGELLDSSLRAALPELCNVDQLESAHYDCFPSGHTELSMLACWGSQMVSRKLFYVFLPRDGF